MSAKQNRTRQYPLTSWCRFMILVSVLALLYRTDVAAQSAEAPVGSDSFEHMAEYLSRGTGQWRAVIPSREGGPDALGLWFDRTAQGRLLELTVVLFYGEEARKGLRGYWLWHPGQDAILYHEVAPSGRVRMGTSHFTDPITFVTLTESVDTDGSKTPNRGVNILLDENEHRTTAYALDSSGEWQEQQSLTWFRETGASAE